MLSADENLAIKQVRRCRNHSLGLGPGLSRFELRLGTANRHRIASARCCENALKTGSGVQVLTSGPVGLEGGTNVGSTITVEIGQTSQRQVYTARLERDVQFHTSQTRVAFMRTQYGSPADAIVRSDSCCVRALPREIPLTVAIRMPAAGHMKSIQQSQGRIQSEVRARAGKVDVDTQHQARAC